MDAQLFDRLTRFITNEATRRRLLAGLATGGLAALLRQGEAAACRAPGKPCRRSRQCCAGTCRRKRGERLGRCRCRKREQACDGFCCPPGSGCCRVESGRQCRILDGDDENCGRCGNSCGGGRCFNSGCVKLCSVLGDSGQCPDGCTCRAYIEGGQDVGRFCVAGDVDCGAATNCTGNDDCPSGEVCVAVPACGSSAVCASPCA